MNYKDKFNAQMKKAGINSLDDLKTDAEKKAFFKAVDKSHDAKNEELLAFAEEAINEFKLKDSDVEKLKQGVKQMPPLKGAKLGKPVKAGYSEEEIKEYTGMGNLPKSVNSNDVATALKNLKKGTKLYVQGKSQGGMRTSGSVVSVSGDTVKINPTASNGPTSVKVKDITMMDTLKEEMKDLQPDAKEINAMVKDPHKSKEGNPKDDILAMWSKESVKADVKAKGGADMAKVQDKAEMMYAMKQINAMYKENKYLPTKEGSIQNVVAQMQVDEMKTVTVRVKEFSQMVETYLARGGVKGFINDELTEGKQVLPLKEVRTFIDTYNRHFLTNYKAEEFIVRDRLNEAIEKEGSMVGKYKVVYDPMANEFGFVNKQAMSDNSKKVGGDSGIKKMMKQGKTVDQISKEFGMFKDAVKMMAD